ncbi:chromatin-binding/pre-rRNA-processing protein IPI3 Ecym_6423 [Eremothecium cymbalariae DBVPG|uniref:Pre-rRNA-processing protein IPI3 n=1 Tax=Eremothecium cymbalariae (strain CBS 270.75 / DBVPG 7215 / KCTC 17166 / NRRL Y-17582) TaxID=931890 RepID=G8JUL5_ERECY|nr:hypothetical protein Ecym_6423 [Eremothecium cymbalariae DBVPG\
MDEELIFTNEFSGTVSQLHSHGQTNLRQCSTAAINSATLVGHRLFVAQANKALINVYNIHGANKRESVEQRLPLPEVVSCIAVVENIQASRCGSANSNSGLPYLLVGSTPTGKLYVWELNSGNLLSVKAMAHYQPITKIQSIVNGKYVITSGSDARLIIWQTADLVLHDDPKPLYILHDHTLPITDFVVSNAYNGDYINTKLFTVSEDATLRCYHIDSQLDKPYLIATFTFALPLTSVTLDPADRCVYVGTKEGAFALPVYYGLDNNETKLVNLLHFGENKILSIIESQEGVDVNRKELYQMGQLVCDKLIPSHITAMKLSMDGSLIVFGTNQGNCIVMDIYSKQPVREVAPIVTQDTNVGMVTNLLLFPATMESESLMQSSVYDVSSKHTEASKIPNLSKSVFDKKGPHDIVFQVVSRKELEKVPPLSDFKEYVDCVAQEESVFLQQGPIQSTVKVINQDKQAEEVVADLPPSKDATDEGAEISKLKETIEQLTCAYKDLRAMHETLYEEHNKLLQSQPSLH